VQIYVLNSYPQTNLFKITRGLRTAVIQH
jgi:hypothetical protein